MKSISPIELAKQKDPKAMKQVIDDHYAMLCSMAHSMKNNHVSHEDLIAEGSLGLITALNKYDPEKKVKFSTYAYYWIKNKMLSYVQKRQTDIPETDILFDHLSFTNNHIPINPSTQQNFITINDMVINMNNYAFEVFLTMTSEQKRKIIGLRHKGQTLEEISRVIHLSKERTRQIEKEFIMEFKEFVKNTLKIKDVNAYINLIFLCEMVDLINYSSIYNQLIMGVFLFIIYDNF
jgi:RNA polymerase sigma factor (sigma-70 family)